MVKGRAIAPVSELPCLPLPCAHLKPFRPFPRSRPLLSSAFSSSSSSSPPRPSTLDTQARPSMDCSSPPAELPPAARIPSPPSADSEDSPDRFQDLGFLCGRQRLQQHRLQMGGNVAIPETWGMEQKLQEWVSYGIVEDALHPAGLMTARTALVSECQRRGRKPVRMPAQAAIAVDVEVS